MNSVRFERRAQFRPELTMALGVFVGFSGNYGHHEGLPYQHGIGTCRFSRSLVVRHKSRAASSGTLGLQVFSVGIFL